MVTSSFSSLLLAVTVAATAAVLLPLADASVSSLCKDISDGNPNVDFNFCVKSLSAAPGSGSEDTKGLALIASDLATKKAKSVAAKVADLLKNPGGVKQKSSLESCSDVYAELEDNLNTAVKAIREGRLDDAKTYLSASVDDPSTCEQGFQDLGVSSPLTAEDDDERQLCIIALAATNRI